MTEILKSDKNNRKLWIFTYLKIASTRTKKNLAD